MSTRAEQGAGGSLIVRLDPADHLASGASLAAIEAGKTWRELETAP